MTLRRLIIGKMVFTCIFTWMTLVPDKWHGVGKLDAYVRPLLCRNVSIWRLNWFVVSHDTASHGSSFHKSTTLWLKIYFLQSSLSLCLYSLVWWHFVLECDEKVKNVVRSSCSLPLIISEIPATCYTTTSVILANILFYKIKYNYICRSKQQCILPNMLWYMMV
jgi:hypothetical protein